MRNRFLVALTLSGLVLSGCHSSQSSVTEGAAASKSSAFQSAIGNYTLDFTGQKFASYYKSKWNNGTGATNPEALGSDADIGKVNISLSPSGLLNVQTINIYGDLTDNITLNVFDGPWLVRNHLQYRVGDPSLLPNTILAGDPNFLKALYGTFMAYSYVNDIVPFYSYLNVIMGKLITAYPDKAQFLVDTMSSRQEMVAAVKGLALSTNVLDTAKTATTLGNTLTQYSQDYMEKDSVKKMFSVGSQDVDGSAITWTVSHQDQYIATKLAPQAGVSPSVAVFSPGHTLVITKTDATGNTVDTANYDFADFSLTNLSDSDLANSQSRYTKFVAGWQQMAKSVSGDHSIYATNQVFPAISSLNTYFPGQLDHISDAILSASTFSGATAIKADETASEAGAASEAADSSARAPTVATPSTSTGDASTKSGSGTASSQGAATEDSTSSDGK